MKNVISLLLFAFIAGSIHAQDISENPFMIDANGKPLYLQTSYIAEGSPYFYDDYCFGEITSSDGKLYSNVKLKIDLAEKYVIYMTDAGQEMIATTPISKIKLMNTVYNGIAYGEVVLQGFNSPLNTGGGKIYQLLEEGKATLLKDISVTYSDSKKYGEANITRVYKRTETWFAMFDNKPVLKKAEKNKNSIIALFETKQDKIRDYIEKENLKCKSEQDIIRVFKYYNSL